MPGGPACVAGVLLEAVVQFSYNVLAANMHTARLQSKHTGWKNRKIEESYQKFSVSYLFLSHPAMQAASADSSVGFPDGHGAVELCGGNGLHLLTAQSVSLTGRTDTAWL